MSRPSKSVTLARLNDTILGCFSRVQPSETLDHLVRFLSTWSGSDKLFMVIQYAVKLIVPLLHLRARLQHRTGLRAFPTSRAAEGYAKLGSVVSDSRMLWRIWGLLPIFQWLISLERKPQPTRALLNIERLQGWSMLGYYPLEHLYYLITKGIIPSSIPSPLSLFSSKSRPIKLNADALGIWSCRFWMAYVLLHFAHLREDRKLLQLRQRTLKKSKASGLTPADKEELEQRWNVYLSDVITNIGYLPLTLHWSLESGLFKNDVWVGIFGLIAAATSFRAGWKATALPSPPPPTPPEAAAEPEAEKPTAYDVSN